MPDCCIIYVKDGAYLVHLALLQTGAADAGPNFGQQKPASSCERPARSHLQVKRVGKYEIGKTLGEGTFGKVKYAVNTETGEKVRRAARQTPLL